jgi:hypothetical protein
MTSMSVAQMRKVDGIRAVAGSLQEGVLVADVCSLTLNHIQSLTMTKSLMSHLAALDVLVVRSLDTNKEETSQRP